MSKDRTWFIKCEKNGKHVLTMFDDGYVFNEKGKKLFVLQKDALNQVRNLVNEYSTSTDGSIEDENISVKCNLDPIFISHNRTFFDQLTNLMFSGQNIKHPPGQLDTIINEIERLRTTGKLKEMIKASGQASFIDSLIEQFNIEND
jgi:hypothetical protein